MLRGLYSSTSGLVAEALHLDILSHNMANANTAGFKRERFQLESRSLGTVRQEGGRLSGRPLGTMGIGLQEATPAADLSQGPLRRTGNPLHLALRGEGYFVVRGADGRELYTRDGTFVVDAEGYLATPGGARLQGEEGDLEVGPAPRGGAPEAALTIDPDGTVHRGDEVIGVIRRVRFQRPGDLDREGGNLLAAEEEPRPADTAILSGHLEESNVNPVTEMVDLIGAMRAYEANARLVRVQDETLAAALRVGRVSS